MAYRSNKSSTLPKLPEFEDFLRNKKAAETYVSQMVKVLKKNGWWSTMQKMYARESTTSPTRSYPSQGLIKTEQDRSYGNKVKAINKAFFEQVIYDWLYYIELFNHPQRLKYLFAVSKTTFTPPPARFSLIFFMGKLFKRAIAINELALHISKADKDRTKRTERFLQGPFVKLGRQARTVFVGSANPDIWGSVPAIASMAMSHCLVGVPRDGYFRDLKRQATLAKDTLDWIRQSPVLLHVAPAVRKTLLDYWIHNVMGVLEASPDRVVERAMALYKVGVRTFRIYSPEPGLGPLESLEAVRNLAKIKEWEPIEVFVGQVVSVQQAQDLDKAGAAGIIVGIGGGGRCTTGVRSGSAIDWPQLVWDLRGKISIPVIIEGGASDHIAQTLTVGATGIGVTRTVGGGTIESPGGYRYFEDEQKRLFKYYRGEASAGMKLMGGKEGPFDIIPYVEGQSTRVLLEFGRGNLPTILQKLNLLIGDNIMALVFQNVDSVTELADCTDSLRVVSPAESELRHTH